MRIPILLLTLCAPAVAVEIRVATFNVGATFGETFFIYGLGEQGTADHESVRAVLERIDADVVALQEIHPADLPDDLDDLAGVLGYSYSHVAPTSSAGPLSGPIDTSLRVAFLSRYPFLEATSIRSPEGARELTRLHPVIKVDVPGTDNDPLLISAHLKAGTGTDDRFRRAIEMQRLVGHLGAAGLTEADNFIILGDFNPSSSNTTFNSAPDGLPGIFSLGGDITFPVSYSTNLLDYFSSPGAFRLDPRQLDGSDSTFGTTFSNGPTLDLILVSPAISARPFAAEIYNSALDGSNATGLPKNGSPLAADTSRVASDHYAVFADLELDSDFPDLTLTLSSPVVTEGDDDGTVTLTVTLPAPRATAVTVNFSSDDPAVVPVEAEVLIPAGNLSAVSAVRTPRNFIADPSRTVTFTATATGYDEDSSTLQVEDADGPYVFTAAGQTVMENFSGFTGDQDPAPWTTTGGLPWQGIDDGSSGAAGLRAYGATGDPSFGFLPEGAGTVAVVPFVNQSAVPLAALEIAFDVEQWRSASGGTADVLEVELAFDGETVPLPELAHAASQTLPDGAVAGGLTTQKSTMLSGLAIPPGASFELRFIFTPGPGGGVAPADVFLNEFHYDNEGTDVGEFIEVVVGPGFDGDLTDIEVVLYNGTNPAAAVTYGSVSNLAADFVPGETSAGYRIFHADIEGIQNGGNDGFAIVNTATSQVLQLLSYEGTFTAGNGPAAGMTSIDVGVAQGSSTPEGSSLGLTGSGGVPGDFSWVVSSGTNSKGAPNAGQSFVLPVLPSQGMAIDNLSVTFVADPDLDSDHDGQSDADEIAFGTDPFDATSVFRPVISREEAGLTLAFPGAEGISYTVEWSTDLEEWNDLSGHLGDGAEIIVPLPEAEPEVFLRVRAGQ